MMSAHGRTDFVLTHFVSWLLSVCASFLSPPLGLLRCCDPPSVLQNHALFAAVARPDGAPPPPPPLVVVALLRSRGGALLLRPRLRHRRVALLLRRCARRPPARERSARLTSAPFLRAFLGRTSRGFFSSPHPPPQTSSSTRPSSACLCLATRPARCVRAGLRLQIPGRRLAGSRAKQHTNTHVLAHTSTLRAAAPHRTPSRARQTTSVSSPSSPALPSPSHSRPPPPPRPLLPHHLSPRAPLPPPRASAAATSSSPAPCSAPSPTVRTFTSLIRRVTTGRSRARATTRAWGSGTCARASRGGRRRRPPKRRCVFLFNSFLLFLLKNSMSLRSFAGSGARSSRKEEEEIQGGGGGAATLRSDIRRGRAPHCRAAPRAAAVRGRPEVLLPRAQECDPTHPTRIPYFYPLFLSLHHLTPRVIHPSVLTPSIISGAAGVFDAHRVPAGVQKRVHGAV